MNRLLMDNSELANRKGYKQTKLGLIPKDWSVCTFKDIADKKTKWSITGGPFGSDLKAEHYRDDGIRIIQLQNIGDGEFRDNSKIYTSTDKADQLLACNIFPGEIILSKMGDPVARACIIPNTEKRWVMGSDGIRLVVDESQYDKRFVLDYINFSIFRKLAISRSTGSTRRRIGLVDLKKIPFIKLPLTEQQKIANILSTWDKAITAQEKLITEKHELKNGLMQQLLTGKKRFSGFEDEWKQSSLGKIGDVKMCKRIFNSETNPNIGIPFYKIGTFGKKPDAFIDEELFNVYKRKYSYPKIGEILISASGTIGRTVVYNGELAYYQDSNIIWIENDEKLITNEFLLYVLKSVHFETEGGTIKRLYSYILKGTKFLLPSLTEQQKIVNILDAANKEIVVFQENLQKMRKQKKGLMQQLLTGEKRVKV